MTEPNCTKLATGQFVGFAATNADTVGSFFTDNLYPKFELDCSDPAAEVTFFTIFGVLFSGVTGIIAGANMSGELNSPDKNIPRGTLSACLFTFTIFKFLSFLTALTCNPTLLKHDCMYMNDLIFWTPIVTIGVLLATFSASLNNLIGASRVLEAVAKDIMFGPILAFVTKGTIKDNPVAAVVFTWFFVELFLLMGSLNTAEFSALSAQLLLSEYGLPWPQMGCSPKLQAVLPVLLLANLPGGPDGHCHNDVFHLSILLCSQCPTLPLLGLCPELPVPDQDAELGLHQPGTSASPGQKVSASP